MLDKIKSWYEDHEVLTIVLIVTVLVVGYIGLKALPDGCEDRNKDTLSCRVQLAEENGCEIPQPILNGYGEVTNEGDVEGAVGKCGY